MSTLSPILETPRLLPRPMQAEDVNALLEVFGDPKVMAAFGVEPFGRGQMERWVARNLDHQAAHGDGLFSVIHKNSAQLIGDCGLELMEMAGVTVAELGYDLRADHWNRGYSTEADQAVRDYAFGELKPHGS